MSVITRTDKFTSKSAKNSDLVDELATLFSSEPTLLQGDDVPAAAAAAAAGGDAEMADVAVAADGAAAAGGDAVMADVAEVVVSDGLMGGVGGSIAVGRPRRTTAGRRPRSLSD